MGKEGKQFFKNIFKKGCLPTTIILNSIFIDLKRLTKKQLTNHIF